MLEKPEVQSCNFCELQKRISKIVRAGRPVTNFYGQKELVNQKFQVVQTNQTIVFWLFAECIFIRSMSLR